MTTSSKVETPEESGSSRNKKRLAVLAVGLVVLAGAGVALAAYLSSGSGTGSATSTSAQSSTITPSNTSTGLYPGATLPVTVTINNPNAYPVRVTSISAGSSNATGTAGACTAGTVTTAAVASPPTTVIAAGASGTYTLNATMAANPDNSCQGQTFTLPLTSQLASAAS